MHECGREDAAVSRGCACHSYRASNADPPRRERTMHRTCDDEQESHGPMTLVKGIPTLAAASAKRTVEHARIYGIELCSRIKIPLANDLDILDVLPASKSSFFMIQKIRFDRTLKYRGLERIEPSSSIRPRRFLSLSSFHKS
jgi:hypothetical protein